MQLYRNGNQDLIHWNLKEISECVKIIYRGEGFAFLPFINGARFSKAKIALQVSDGHTALHAQSADVISRGGKINHGIFFRVQYNRLLQEPY